jgi:Mg2+-importing ATPase
LLGRDVLHLSDEELSRVVDRNNIFARVTPAQKERIILAFKHNGHVVGFMGDGINDAPPMKAADVSISVENAVDVAKETADIILLEKDLRVLSEGVLEGRTTFGNTEKYMKYSISSNFGTMFSAAAGSLFVPFLPMLPTQVLLNNLLNDIAQVPLPMDRVDQEYVVKPKRLSIPFISRFMVIFGPLSSIFDIAMFITMLVLFTPFNPNGSLNDFNISQFQTAFFVETLSCQLIILFIIRTRRVPFWRSKPNPVFACFILLILAVALTIPYTPLGPAFGFVP